MLKVDHVSGGYGDYRVIKDVCFSVNKGEFFGILGPNGSGKTTLLKMISGILPSSEGSIQVSNKNIAQFSRKDLAKVLAVLPQLAAHTFPYTVKETVALGRYAHHQGLFQTWSAEDEAILQEIMVQTNIVDFQNHALQELSGGEQQRVFLAQALVQKPAILLLDEPTNHLDLAHQKDLLDLLKRSAKQQGLTVISIFHDLNLASLYCDRLLLLHQGEMKVLDTPDHVLTEPLIKEVYRTEVKKSPHPEVAKIQMHLLPQEDDTQAENVTIDHTLLDIHRNHIALRSPIPLRTLSSGVCGAGSGWNANFVNRHVDKDYNCSDHVQDMSNYLINNDFDPNRTVGMMTAVQLEDVAWTDWKGDAFSLFIVITAGVGNATDSARVSLDHLSDTNGTINTWIFVNGRLTEEAFIQSVMTATEAKTQALRELNIKDAKTGTPATGTSTDSILIAATQQGEQLAYAGTATTLGKAIGENVFKVTKKAIERSLKRGQTK